MSMQQPNSGANTTGEAQQQQFVDSSALQQGDAANVTLAGGAAESRSPLKKTPASEPQYQLLAFFGLAAKIGAGYVVNDVNHAQELIARAGHDGAKLHATAFRPIGSSDRADLMTVFSGKFNAAQQTYLNDIRKVAIPATDPNLENVQPWTSGSTVRVTETQHSYASLAPD